jgi:hypothetical protein
MSYDITAGGEPELGRRKHLGRLAHVFYRRGATWGDFGGFLQSFFAGNLHRKRGDNPLFHEQKCRHNVSGRHHETLQDSVGNPDLYPMFNHERYSRACLSFGKGDADKNAGFVVSDTCQKARTYLESIGKGEVVCGLGEDSDYEDDQDEESSSDESDRYLDPQSSDYGSSQVTDDFPASEAEMLSVAPGDSGSDNDSDLSELEVTIDDWDDPDAEETGEDVDISMLTEFPSSQVTVDLPGADGRVRRTSTKVRAATLGYLWGFVHQPTALRDAFRTLRTTELLVLHLCGCGMKHVNSDGEICPGCMEWSHLKLGTAVENGRHKIWHQAMSLTREEDYSDLCGIVHRGQDGCDLF